MQETLLSDIYSIGEEERGLYNNKKSIRSPAWCVEDITNNHSEYALIDYVASILVEAFLDKKQNEFS